MKRILFASLAIVAMASGSAVAADLPAPVQQPAYFKAPPPPPPTWTGCYVNGGGGYGMWSQDHSTTLAATGASITPTTTAGGNGWFGVVGGGCDYQFNAFHTWDVVIGAFGDYDFMNIKGSLAGPFSTAFSGNENERSAWSAGARAGLLVTPTLLTYVNGGYTQTSFDQVNFANAAGVGALSLSSNTYNGWFLGGGTEYAVTWLPIPGLFWRNEYRYSSYSNANVGIVATATGAPTAFNLQADKAVQTIATELVWRFNWSAPLAARY